MVNRERAVEGRLFFRHSSAFVAADFKLALTVLRTKNGPNSSENHNCHGDMGCIVW